MVTSQGRSVFLGRRFGLLVLFLTIMVGQSATNDAVQDEAGQAQVQAQELRKFYVNTTEDKGVNSRHCLPGQDCPFRAALEFARSARGVPMWHSKTFGTLAWKCCNIVCC